MLKTVALLGCTFAVLFGTAAPQDPEPAAPQAVIDTKIRELMGLMGAGDMGQQVMTQMMAQFQNMPGLPDGFVETFTELADARELIDLVVPIYRKHLDEETIDAAIGFWSSEAGQKLRAAQPAITQESMEAGSRWGQELAARVMEELREREPK